MPRSVSRQYYAVVKTSGAYQLQAVSKPEAAELSIEDRANSDFVVIQGIPQKHSYEERNDREEWITNSPGMVTILALVRSLGLDHQRQSEYGVRLRRQDFRRLVKALSDASQRPFSAPKFAKKPTRKEKQLAREQRRSQERTLPAKTKVPRGSQSGNKIRGWPIAYHQGVKTEFTEAEARAFVRETVDRAHWLCRPCRFGSNAAAQFPANHLLVGQRPIEWLAELPPPAWQDRLTVFAARAKPISRFDNSGIWLIEAPCSFLVLDVIHINEVTEVVLLHVPSFAVEFFRSAVVPGLKQLATQRREQLPLELRAQENSTNRTEFLRRVERDRVRLEEELQVLPPAGQPVD